MDERLATAADSTKSNKTFLQERLQAFESGVIAELKKATAHLNMEAYESSFQKIESDIAALQNTTYKVEQS